MASESSSVYDEDGPGSWIEWFCALPGHEFFAEVAPDFIEDSFNLYGLKSMIPYHKDTIAIILGPPPNTDKDGLRHSFFEYAKELYGLIHARYIVTAAGLQDMLRKYESVEFSPCPRSLCKGTQTLPMGLSNDPKDSYVKLFCPRCEDIYEVPHKNDNSRLDGAYFGPTFPHIFLISKPQLQPPKDDDMYVPRIFGFRVATQLGRVSLENGYRLIEASRNERRAHIRSIARANLEKSLELENNALASRMALATSQPSSAHRNRASSGSNSSNASPPVESSSSGKGSSSQRSQRTSRENNNSNNQTIITSPRPNFTLFHPSLLINSRGRIPLTSPWKGGKRPAYDDFNSADEGEERHRDLVKRTRLNNM